MNTLELPKQVSNLEFKARYFSVRDGCVLAARPMLRHLALKRCKISEQFVKQICSLPNLETLSFEGSRISDGLLRHLARLPKLRHLTLDRTPIKGDGFKYFHDHTALKVLWISNSKITDNTIHFLCNIPNLQMVVAKNTRVTARGLLKLATRPTLTVNVGRKMSRSTLEAFELEQLRVASRTPIGFRPSVQDTESAREALQDFFDAMNRWETTVARANKNSRSQNWRTKEVAALMRAFCAKSCLKRGRHVHPHYSFPPEYSMEKIVFVEWLTSRRVVFHTKHQTQFRRRYEMLRTGDSWRVNRKEELLGGKWQLGYL